MQFNLDATNERADRQRHDRSLSRHLRLSTRAKFDAGAPRHGQRMFERIKNFIKKEKVDIQLVEPHNHRVNAAEPAVKATKYLMIAGLATVDITCPLRL